MVHIIADLNYSKPQSSQASMWPAIWKAAQPVENADFEAKIKSVTLVPVEHAQF